MYERRKVKNLKHYIETSEAVLKELDTTKEGLMATEAEARLEKNGKNKLAEGKKETLIMRFLKQLAEPMTIILIVAAVISGILAIVEKEFPTDVIIIMAVVLINAVLGVLQESKAEKALEALEKIAAATSKVIRDGHQITIKSEDLVVGDIIVLEAGDAVPADARIIECASLKIEEAALTGESVPVDKKEGALEAGANGDVPLGDRKNMVFMGSTVVYGRGKAVITATGMDTEMGKIADALSNAQEGKTPLQMKLSQLSKILTYLVIGICVVVFGINIIRSLMDGNGIRFDTVLDTFMVAISLAVAAIPEGLATVVTIVLSIGVTNMSKRNAIIRKLTAVETLGCTQIICSDKTGTLTQNKMTVVEHFGSDESLLANGMSLCSDAEFDTEAKTAIGEPTECALVNYAEALNLSKNEQKKIYERIGEVPFDSMRKMMTTVHNNNGTLIQFTKGAPDEILKRCVSVYENGEKIPLTEEKREQILGANKNMADRALRVLAVGFKNHEKEPEEYEAQALENDLCFIGLVGMIDPVRPEVKPAIDECRNAGIRPIMITGDHKDTAVAIAMQLGIIESADQAITGAELDDISDEDFDTLVEKYSVYARVQPEHKTRIVNAWRKKGKVTAMTGDGVNDAPSIKNADIGVGMGITGTDVTKNVADMILTDDNFATIVSAVGEGRRIYDNIRKSIQFLLASNLSEVLTIFFATLFGFSIFKPVHLLWINLITDCLPALSLGMEKAEGDIMKRKPRDSKEGIFAGGLGVNVVYQGILVTVITLVSYFIGANVLAEMHHAEAIAAGTYTANGLGTSMAFLTLSMAEIFHSFNMRSINKSIFKMKHQNIWLWGAAGLSLLLTTLVIEIPFLADAFELAHLDLMEYGIALALALCVIPVVEIAKLITRIVAKKKEQKTV
ncbi:MAG: calcium-translocating P-type ATPase, PMCA-type [Clostridia bacterium]|nr:calcium-translocating P-type ATPase, PMCA-type [Clostridia bacterium]